MIDKFLIRRLRKPSIWRRIAVERLTEPLHLNLLSSFVALFGGWKAKTAFDLVLRPHNAYAILDASERSGYLNKPKLALCEFGVATGAGLMNMAFLAQRISKITGVEIRVFGFDTGCGMPDPIDYRDHPELYASGDFKMDQEALRARLPGNAELIIGNIRDSIPAFLVRLGAEGYKVGYVVIDVDYYSSTCDALTVFGGHPELYLPIVQVYLDDIQLQQHNPSAGELLAVDEFNAKSAMRKIYKDEFLENRRIFKRASWIHQMRSLHVLDHPERNRRTPGNRKLDNPYLDTSPGGSA
jgi:hypothetical protein